MKALRLSEDIISDLPECIIEKILTCLPIRNAVRTSILSKKWRYNWATIPKLVFCDNIFDGFTESEILSSALQVLFLHKGPILEFALALPKVERSPEIDRLIVFLSRNGLETFTLSILNGIRYKLPSSFFSSLQLKHLTLRFCTFKPPLTFKGFSKLLSLSLTKVDIAAEVLEGFISNCPVLESLAVTSSNVIRYRIVDHHKINAPGIKYLYLKYAFQEKVVEEHSEGTDSYFIELFDYLSVSIEQLTMGRSFFQNLVAGTVPKTLPKTLDRLKILRLAGLRFEEMRERSFALCLIRSSPNLKIIDFRMSLASRVAVPTQQLPDFSDINLNHLIEVKIDRFSGLLPEMNLVKFLLAKSPVLIRMQINPHPVKVTDKGLRILKHLTKYRRASPLVEVTFGNPF